MESPLSCIVPPEEKYGARTQELAQLLTYHEMESEHPILTYETFKFYVEQSRKGPHLMRQYGFIPFYFKG